MKITAVGVRKVDYEHTKAFVDITLDACFMVHCEVKDGRNGLYLSFPSKKTKNPEKPYTDTAHPITAEFRTELINAVMDKFHETDSQSNAGELFSQKQATNQSTNNLEPVDPDGPLPF